MKGRLEGGELLDSFGLGAEREAPSGAGFQSEAIDAKASDAGQEWHVFPGQVSFGNAALSLRACSERLRQSPERRPRWRRAEPGARDALWHCGARAGPASSPPAQRHRALLGQLGSTTDSSLPRCHCQWEQVRSCL